jgi:hypothetical protein
MVHLCIKCPVYKPEVENTGNQMGYTCAPQDYKIWLGHAKIDRVKNKKEKAGQKNFQWNFVDF